MRHLDLFSGIGGFAYAARDVWGEEYENVGFCEIDPFCQSVLRKNFPGCQIFEDIKVLANYSSEGLEGSDRTQSPLPIGTGCVDLVTGGFPCQPFSVAGRRRGTSDDRYLWPEMFRVIQSFKPSWVIGENVGGLVTWNEGMVLEQVCADLESEGYEVQPFIIPACAVNAPHRRDRVWIVAHANDHRPRRTKRSELGAQNSLPQEYRQENCTARQPIGTDSDWQNDQLITDYRPQRWSERSQSQPEWPSGNNSRFGISDWDKDWREVALATCHDGMDDGLSQKVVRLPDGSTISYARWRKEALKSYGNAIVPQVAGEIIRAIREGS
jgi:DNA (cytosine-5)-methyltransferase 1